jgi:hypothetical protein
VVNVTDVAEVRPAPILMVQERGFTSQKTVIFIDIVVRSSNNMKVNYLNKVPRIFTATNLRISVRFGYNP